ncbi:TetR/AcrR family transcriptional regulator [Amycolatopsis rubida]|uniref:TetR/AcrR family transcriptional regulator n=1 Tax=Amycolatopsis rubida TaxID=112413 RepID=A0ABX0BVG0_9PSEU|nr:MULTISPECIES: TetR/AcrR family transcriptional regulator [Amycolatopsis]MYW93970.1 TetR family transcriptional regulator [Amycolatopsis rubida]NEC58959.1 TetR/AcrR family transcriptional regulator [Amycolatopsis rubida]OAP21739.1 DNA-binding transcriptional repressor AcrR [Amycolatopsis sp. M39]
MPNRGDRGGAKTRARIAEVATGLFLERGFDAVTIAEVAAAAGVSKVTVFSHFERKEDLLLDRLPEAIELVRSAVRERTGGVVDALRQLALTLQEDGHVLSGVGGDIEPLMRTVGESPALIARLRAFGYEMEAELAAELAADARFSGDAALVAALVVAAYRTVTVETIRRRLEGQDLAELRVSHRERLTRAFDAVDRLVGG